MTLPVIVRVNLPGGGCINSTGEPTYRTIQNSQAICENPACTGVKQNTDPSWVCNTERHFQSIPVENTKRLRWTMVLETRALNTAETSDPVASLMEIARICAENYQANDIIYPDLRFGSIQYLGQKPKNAKHPGVSPI